MPAPDLTAPRFRRRHQGTVNQASLQELRQRVPGVAHLSDQQLITLLGRITKVTREAIVDLPGGVELPEQLGRLFIGSCPGLLAKRVDYKSSQKLGQTVQHRNWASDDFQAKIFYQNHLERYHFRHRELWAFAGCRLLTRAVGASYPQLWQQYVRVESNRKSKALQHKQIQQLEQRIATQQQLATYDEFDL